MSEGSAPDLFAVLDLPRRYPVDAADLERRFHERSRVLHPDRFARATPRERRLALERTTRLNLAYRTLRDPCARAEHLLSLLSPASPMGDAGAPFLEEQLEAREALTQARARRDLAAVERIRAGSREALRVVEGELARVLGAETPPAEAIEAARAAVARARFHRAMLAACDSAADARLVR